MSSSTQGGDMQKILVRAVFAGVTIGSAAIIGLATPAAADAPCSLVVVCPPANPAPPDAPAPAPQPPAQQPPSAQPDQPEQPAPRSSADVTADLFTMLDQERSSRGLPLLTRRGDIDG